MFRCISRMLCENIFIFGEFILFVYVLDIDVTRNGNNLKLKVKSEFSLSMGLMLINHSIPYIPFSQVGHSNSRPKSYFSFSQLL